MTHTDDPTTLSANPMRDFDVALGLSLRRRRQDAGLTQQDLAAACGISFQQIQKYEQGVNRIAASRLIQIAKALDISVAQILNLEPDALTSLDEGALASRLLSAALRLNPTNLSHLVVLAERVADADTAPPRLEIRSR